MHKEPFQTPSCPQFKDGKHLDTLCFKKCSTCEPGVDCVGSEPILSWKGAACRINHNEMGKEKTEKRGQRMWQSWETDADGAVDTSVLMLKHRANAGWALQRWAAIKNSSPIPKQKQWKPPKKGWDFQKTNKPVQAERGQPALPSASTAALIGLTGPRGGGAGDQ